MIVKAPAKINLALHITGQRADGYHTLESLVTFAGANDTLSFSIAQEDRLTFSGPFGARLESDLGPNLVMKARDALRAHVNSLPCPPVAIHLEKNLPLASGIGGGSADAAAVLKGLNRHWQLDLDDATLAVVGRVLGADVPMCVYGRPLVARGIGHDIELAGLPNLSMLLVNPNLAVSTQAIFQKLTTKNNAPMPSIGQSIDSLDALLFWLATTRNDLEPPAIALCPAISDVMAALRIHGARFARMSGSGATCFGLFENEAALNKAAAKIRDDSPDWWVA